MASDGPNRAARRARRRHHRRRVGGGLRGRRDGAVIRTALGNEYFPSSLFHPIDEITLRILEYARDPYDVWHEQAYGAALLLVLGVALGSLLLRLTTRDFGAPGRTSSTLSSSQWAKVR